MNQIDEGATLLTCLPVETRLSFPLDDGCRLSFERGTIRCAVGFFRLPKESQSEWDWVLARLDVADATGRVHRLERRLIANLFLELVRMADGHSHKFKEPTLVLEGIRCAYDHRVYIPTAALVEGRVQAFAYWAKGLWVDIDLLKYRLGQWDRLVIRVHEVEGGALGGVRAPTITVESDWAVKVIVWPSLLMSCYEPIGEQPVFAATGESAEPQETVTVSS